MGSGSFSNKKYVDDTTFRRSTGKKDFGYSDDVHSGRAHGIHESLDPMQIKNGVRESRDSDEHPNSLPIAVFFDVTGSMHWIPEALQKKLVTLMDVVKNAANIADPQILMGAIGDSTCDKFPFQVGQFESDNRFDEQLRNIILEGGGGGQHMESYALAYCFMANHTESDSFEKRGKKGYFFTIGDEAFWPKVSVNDLKTIFNVGSQLDFTMEELAATVRTKWHVFHLHANEGSYRDNPIVLNPWRELLGERVIVVEDAKKVCEIIAGLILSIETAQHVDSVMSHLGPEADNTVRKAITGAIQDL